MNINRFIAFLFFDILLFTFFLFSFTRQTSNAYKNNTSFLYNIRKKLKEDNGILIIAKKRVFIVFFYCN